MEHNPHPNPLPKREREFFVWTLTDGSAGMAAQARALAQALGVPVEMKKIALKPAFAWLPNAVLAWLRPWIFSCMLDKSKSDALDAPWPKLIISCGRKAAAVAMGMKTVSNAPTQATHFIHIQDPQCNPAHFDLVIAMAHDSVRGPNVLTSRYALHSITQHILADARARFAARFAGYAAPRVAVLVGGSTNKYRLEKNAMQQVISQLEQLCAASGALLITPSRRTGEENTALLARWAQGEGKDNIYLYDGKEENPYMGLLALADVVVVTNDSVNMMSEALASGKPVYLLALPGHANSKPARFAEALVKDGLARWWSGSLEPFASSWVDEMPQLAAQVRAKISMNA